MTPVAVEVWRGPRVESRHRVSVMVADGSGRTILALGDIDRPIYPRSAVKPFQALPLLETGAADALGVTEAELALACASHSAEPSHLELVGSWLARLGVDDEALVCGPHAPLHAASAEALIRAGLQPRKIHNNCSGKHTGMLTLAKHLGVSLEGYAEPEHPVQRLVRATMEELTDGAVERDMGIDGCGLPTFAMPLRALATAFARFASPEALGPDRARAARRVGEAMRRHPQLVAGTGRCCSAVMTALPGVLAKTGAEGVYVAAVAGRGLGIALKAEDGAGRAAEVALLAILDRLGLIDGGAAAELASFATPTLRNAAGRIVGRIAPAEGWLAQRT